MKNILLILVCLLTLFVSCDNQYAHKYYVVYREYGNREKASGMKFYAQYENSYVIELVEKTDSTPYQMVVRDTVCNKAYKFESNVPIVIEETNIKNIKLNYNSASSK